MYDYDHITPEDIIAKLNSFSYDEGKCVTVYNQVKDTDKELLDIQNNITELLSKRNSILRQNYLDIKTIAGAINILGVPNYVLYQEFRKNNFDSDVIKTAVAKIRKMFFDDTQEMYQAFNCVDIKEDQMYSSELSFFFKDDSSNIEFSIDIPSHCSRDNSKVQMYENYGGYMSISYKPTDYFHARLCSSYIVSEIRTSLKDFIKSAYNSTRSNDPSIKDEFATKYIIKEIEKFRNDLNKKQTLSDEINYYLSSDIVRNFDDMFVDISQTTNDNKQYHITYKYTA